MQVNSFKINRGHGYFDRYTVAQNKSTPGYTKENRNYKRMCIKSETSMCIEDDFGTATAIREFLIMECDLFVDRRMANDINEIIEYLCTK